MCLFFDVDYMYWLCWSLVVNFWTLRTWQVEIKSSEMNIAENTEKKRQSFVLFIKFLIIW